MKLKFKFSEPPWYVIKNILKSKDNKEIAELKGKESDEKADNAMLMSLAPDFLNALIAEEAYSSMDCQEGYAILDALGYKEGSRMDFVRQLRKDALKKCGII